MFNRYYQSELTYLRELGKEFSEAHPDLAALFEDRGDDPDVDRLLEGFAFLTARIRERLDDAVPELVDPLTQMLLPHYARTLPAATIMEFVPNVSTLRSRHRIEAGAEVASRPVQGTPCKFRTTRPIDLLPLTTDAAALDTTAGSAPEIRLSLSTIDEGGGPVFLPGGIDFFLNGQLAQSSMLLLWFLRHLEAITYVSEDGYVQELPADKVSAPGLGEDAALVPWPELATPSAQLLQAYFNLPAAMLFVRIDGLERIPSEHATRTFELKLRFRGPPPLPERLDAGHFRPNCVPAVNLFDVDADPVKRDPLVREHLLRASGLDPRHMAIYSVNKVTGVRAHRRDRIDYPPFFDFAHSAEAASNSAFHTLRRCHSPVDDGLDCYLTVATPRDVEPTLEDETFSIELTCTNRHLSTGLHVGDICVPTRRSPSTARFRNITPVSVPVMPPLGAELHWRLLSHLALNQRTLGNVKTLSAMIALYNFHQPQQQQGRANRNRAEALRAVSMRPSAQLVDRAMVRGIQTTVTVDETRFGGTGDVFLMGCVLDAMLGAQVPMNSFNQLAVELHPSDSRIEWLPKNGQQALL